MDILFAVITTSETAMALCTGISNKKVRTGTITMPPPIPKIAPNIPTITPSSSKRNVVIILFIL